MSNKPTNYKGKPIAYVDQNVIDAIRRHGLAEFQTWLLSKYTPVYSNETLEEIKRSGQPYKYLGVLEGLGAKHIHPLLDLNYQIVDHKGVLTHRCPFEIYDKYIADMPSYNSAVASILEPSRKFMGGYDEKSNLEIAESQIENFDKLLGHLTSECELLPDTYKKDISNEINKYRTQHAELVRKSADILDSTPGSKNLQSFRKAFSLGPEVLNNLPEENVIDTIREIITSRMGTDDVFFDLKMYEKSFGRKISMVEKCSAIYGALNIIGYQADPAMNKYKKFTASTSDCVHASYASICDVVLSCDKRFVRKARATYEYLGLNTTVIHVNIHTE